MAQVPSGPTFTPTKEEFADCLAYIRKISPQASQYGICRIVPPKEWKYEYSFPFDSPFPSRKQIIVNKRSGNGKVYGKVEMAKREMKSYDEFIKLNDDIEKKWKRIGVKSDLEFDEVYWKWFSSSANKGTWYASDVEGSAFPCSENEMFGKEWNLRNIARLEKGGGFLSFMNDAVPGVTDPMLYIAMMFSTFCWHYEDNFLYSVSYNHTGASRTWYGVPGNNYAKFEEVAFSSVLPKKFNDEDHIRLKTTMFTPSHLIENGIPVFKLIQRPGDFVFTFPGAFHCGFSHGFSVSEAVNFALPDWLPWGRISIDMYRRVQRIPVVPYQDVVIRAVRFIIETGRLIPQSRHIILALEQLIEAESNLRTSFLNFGCDYLRLESNTLEYCASCGQAINLSYFTCECSPDTHNCLKHFPNHQHCSLLSHKRINLYASHSIAELQNLLKSSKQILELSANH